MTGIQLWLGCVCACFGRRLSSPACNSLRFVHDVSRWYLRDDANEPGAMLEPPASKSYSTDWINRNGTLILVFAGIQIMSGNNDNPADVVLACRIPCLWCRMPDHFRKKPS
jgi:hypothetical protein